jgi:hypothetical protein
VHHRAKYFGIHEIRYPIWCPQDLLGQQFIDFAKAQLGDAKGTKTSAKVPAKKAKTSAKVPAKKAKTSAKVPVKKAAKKAKKTVQRTAA